MTLPFPQFPNVPVKHLIRLAAFCTVLSLAFNTTTTIAKAPSATFAVPTQQALRPVEATIEAEAVQPTPVEVIPMQKPLTGSHEEWMSAAGILQSDWQYVDFIIAHESGWCPTKWNGQRDCPNVPTVNVYGSGAYGLGQALGPEKMAPYGSDFMTNPITQLKWANSYAISRYGSWSGAHSFWVSKHWW